jgi:hypothetical protein
MRHERWCFTRFDEARRDVDALGYKQQLNDHDPHENGRTMDEKLKAAIEIGTFLDDVSLAMNASLL